MVFDYKTYFPEGVYINNSSIFEMINLLKKDDFYKVLFDTKLPRLYISSKDGQYTSLYLREIIFVISFTSKSYRSKEYIKKIAKSLILESLDQKNRPQTRSRSKSKKYLILTYLFSKILIY